MNNILLNNGVKIPQIGFGTWKAPTSEVTINAVKTAIEMVIHISIVLAFMAMKKKLVKALSLVIFLAINYLSQVNYGMTFAVMMKLLQPLIKH